MKVLHSVAAALLIMAATAVTAGAGDNKEKLFYIINYSIYHCNAEIELNGIHMTKSDKDTSYTVTGFSDVGMWIYPGINTVTVTIKPAAMDKQELTDPSVELSISTAKEGQMTNEGKKIMEFRIPEKKGGAQLASIKSPITKKATFTPIYLPPSELWDKVKPVTLDAESRKQIIKIVKDYHTALLRKDTDAVFSLLQFASTDMMRLRHQPLDNLKTKFKDSFKEMMSDKNFILLPLNTEKLVLKPVADGRIIHITDRNGEEPIRTKNIKDSGSYTFAVFAGFVDGKWMIVR